jgi:mRNA-degrading endonuclease YafQ of YafQ-DinJ toxin-antitoxin module
MIRELVLSPRFQRSFRKFVRHNLQLQLHIEQTLVKMREDVFAPNLGTHKLTGDLLGLLACSCGYDCRILFSIQQQPDTQQEVILLLDIGTHDVVY